MYPAPKQFDLRLRELVEEASFLHEQLDDHEQSAQRPQQPSSSAPCVDR